MSFINHPFHWKDLYHLQNPWQCPWPCVWATGVGPRLGSSKRSAPSCYFSQAGFPSPKMSQVVSRRSISRFVMLQGEWKWRQVYKFSSLMGIYIPKVTNNVPRWPRWALLPTNQLSNMYDLPPRQTLWNVMVQCNLITTKEIILLRIFLIKGHLCFAK
jgi:hypothetical protein